MRHVFVVTYGRSGSTVLLNLLNSIPGYCIRGENGGLIKGLAEAYAILRQAKERFGTEQADQPSNPWYGFDQVDVDEACRKLGDVFREQILRPEPDARAVGFKDIRYTPDHMSDDIFEATIDFLLNAFSDPYIVFLSRDPSHVARSGWWKRQDPEKVIKLLENSTSRFEKAATSFADRCILIDHAEYKGKLDGLRKIVDWLGESVSDDHLRLISAHHLNHSKPWTLRDRVMNKVKRHLA